MSLALSSWVRKLLSVITIHLTKHTHPLSFIPIYHFSYHLFHKVFPFPHSGVTNQRVPRVCTCVVLPPDFVKHHSAVSCDYSVDGWHSSEQQGSEQAYSPSPPVRMLTVALLRIASHRPHTTQMDFICAELTCPKVRA